MADTGKRMTTIAVRLTNGQLHKIGLADNVEFALNLLNLRAILTSIQAGDRLEFDVYEDRDFIGTSIPSHNDRWSVEFILRHEVFGSARPTAASWSDFGVRP